MKYEIERRFLVKDVEYAIANKHGFVLDIRQGYLSPRDSKVVTRVRCNDTHMFAYITVKGPKVGAKAPEYEYGIPHEDGNNLLSMSYAQLTKQRYDVWDNDDDEFSWDVDVFTGRHTGLVIAEIELPSEGTEFRIPDWCGEEITTDRRYSNVMLAFDGLPERK